MRKLSLVTKIVIIALLIGIYPINTFAEKISIFYNSTVPQHQFAAKDIKAALEAKSFTVEIKELSYLTKNYLGKKVVITLLSNTKVVKMLKAEGGGVVDSLAAQAYALRTTTAQQTTYWIIGGDNNGAMYGGLQLAENINFKGFGETYNEIESPHLKNRGIKINIPLDIKAPTYFYDNGGTAFKEAIRHVWDMSFWTSWFDEMARNRYNVLSLWSPHPFTSMVNMEDEYPGIAIQGVTGFDENGNEIQVNNMTISEKIEFWQKVMKYGRNRGFEIYFFNWNIFLSTADGKYEITDSPNNPATRIYVRKCMKKFLETYPDIAGFGITVGEKMGTRDNREKEEWVWDTYGMGMMEYAKANPNRELVFIHRQHQGNLTDMLDYFKPLNDLPNVRFDLSFKYSVDRAHSTATPDQWVRANMEDKLGSNNLKSWLTIRNDDWFFLHWAEPQFVRDYINNFPQVDKYVNTFYIGSDGWVFTREFTSKNPYYKEKNALSIQRTWYMQKLWGRIAYNPSISDKLFLNHLALKFPEVSAKKLFDAWSDASGSIRLANEQISGKLTMDEDWWPEGWTGDHWKGNGRFFSVQDIRKAIPFSGSKLCSLSKTAKDSCENKISAWETVVKIDKMANNALNILATLDSKRNTELKLTLRDIQAQANLGLFNAYKFRAVMYVEQDKKDKALEAIGKAYCYWKNYTNIMDELYKAVDLQRNLSFKSWHDHDKDALKDYLDLGGVGIPTCVECK